MLDVMTTLAPPTSNAAARDTGAAVPLVIVPCGKAKLADPAPALDLYTGQFFKACLGYARTLTTPDRILILSAKHGLVDLGTVVEPYEVEFPKGIGKAVVREQARRRGILGEHVVALGGRHYVSICRFTWPGCEMPMEGLGGLGYMLSWLKARTAAAA